MTALIIILFALPVLLAVGVVAYLTGFIEVFAHRRRDGIFRLISEPEDGVFCPYCHRPADVRRYPELDPPATFRDCWSCGVTWEVNR